MDKERTPMQDKFEHVGNKILYLSPIETIWRAYLVSYGNHLKDGESEQDMCEFILKWVRKGHVSPLKHSLLQVSAHSPIFIARQLAKHQVGMEWNEISRRYTDKYIEVYQPNVSEEFSRLSELCVQAYRDAVEAGVPKEQARSILPQGAITTWVWSGSFLAWANVVWQRESKHAQIDVRAYTSNLLNAIKDSNPYIYTLVRECADIIKVNTGGNSSNNQQIA